MAVYLGIVLTFLRRFISGFRGQVTVEPFVSQHHTILITVNGVVASATAAALQAAGALRRADAMSCPAEQSLPPVQSSLQPVVYTYSVCHTPIVQRISSSAVQPGQQISLFGFGFPGESIGAVVTTFTINRLPCAYASASSTSRQNPPSTPSTLSNALLGQTNSLNCTMPFLPSGFYRMVVHVWGRGWAFFANEGDKVQYQPVAMASKQSGSVQGGSLVQIKGEGFAASGAAENQVLIGNTPCDVLSVARSSQGEQLVCVTRAPVDDGYSSVIRRDQPLAYWPFPRMINWRGGTAENNGSIGAAANAQLPSDSIANEPGLTRANGLTGTAVQFNGNPATVPYNAQMFANWSFTAELWMRTKLDDESKYLGYHRQVLGLNADGLHSNGYLLWLNPCGQLEFWLGTGANLTAMDTASEACPVLKFTSTTPDNSTGVMLECAALPSATCSGTRLVNRNDSRDSSLPGGVWSVVQTEVPELFNWTHVVMSFEVLKNDDDGPMCSTSAGNTICQGVQRLLVNGKVVAAVSANYSRANATLEIGGSSKPNVLGYSGWLDEVALYGTNLPSQRIARHHYFGTHDEQLLSVTVNGLDQRGTGITPNVCITSFYQLLFEDNYEILKVQI